MREEEIPEVINMLKQDVEILKRQVEAVCHKYNITIEISAVETLDDMCYEAIVKLNL